MFTQTTRRYYCRRGSNSHGPYRLRMTSIESLVQVSRSESTSVHSALELESRGMRFESEKPIEVRYKQWKIPGQRIDLIVGEW